MTGFTPMPMVPTLAELFERLIRLEALVEEAPPKHKLPEVDPFFEDIWMAWPSHRSDGKQARGNKAKAFRAYLKCVNSRYTPEVLMEAAGYYLNSLEEREGYVQMVATFFGRNKQTWKLYADTILEAK